MQKRRQRNRFLFLFLDALHIEGLILQMNQPKFFVILVSELPQLNYLKFHIPWGNFFGEYAEIFPSIPLPGTLRFTLQLYLSLIRLCLGPFRPFLGNLQHKWILQNQKLWDTRYLTNIILNWRQVNLFLCTRFCISIHFWKGISICVLA